MKFRKTLILKQSNASIFKKTLGAKFYQPIKVREISKKLIETHNLRTLDALQLAAALVWSFEKPPGKIFICCDNKLSEAAKIIGFTVLPK